MKYSLGFHLHFCGYKEKAKFCMSFSCRKPLFPTQAITESPIFGEGGMLLDAKGKVGLVNIYQLLLHFCKSKRDLAYNIMKTRYLYVLKL